MPSCDMSYRYDPERAKRRRKYVKTLIARGCTERKAEAVANRKFPYRGGMT
jgi:hypothetical protein